MMSLERVVAIDGPAGSGKSTVARRLADRLGWDYLDTGAMYRCVCLKALRRGLDLSNEEVLGRLTRRTELDMRFEEGDLRVFMDGEEVTDDIRQNRVSRNVSEVARHPAVRQELVRKQREMASRRNVVVEGRDIGTVVFPDAAHKFYLKAALDIRARRRYTELTNEGEEDLSLEAVIEEIRARDEQDRNRSDSPLRPADDAYPIDTSDRTVEEVVDRIAKHINEPTSSAN